jgi:serine/threonine-protein phosphatase PP1 catalytic subunit
LRNLLWSSPDPNIVGWNIDDERSGLAFGPDVISQFLQDHDMELIVRGHEIVDGGYQFFANLQFVTLFSAANFQGDEGNKAAIMCVDKELRCSFQVRIPLARDLLPG